ncbi:MAG TPA: DUF1302 family protein [Polyangia bacterium]
MRLVVRVALMACLTGVGAARAQTDSGAAPGATAPPSTTPDAGSPAPQTIEPTPGGETAPGLFEQSNAAAAAAPPSNATAEPAAAPSAPFTLSGYVRGDLFAGKVNDQDAAELKSGYGELDLTLRTRKETYGDGFAEARLRYGLQGDGTQGTVVEVREAYVNAYLGPLDLRLGQQIIVWGRADALNPTNNLTPVDFRIRSPLEDDIRLGNAGARAFLRFAPFRLEGVWMPIYLPTELPAVALPQYVSYGPPAYPLLPAMNLKNGTEGARLHLELPAFDMSISYVHGLALLPGLTMTSLTLTADPNTGAPNPLIPPSILISRTAYEQQVFGLDFSTTLGEFGTLRGEAAYRRPYDWSVFPDDHHVAYPDLQYVLGADHTFGSLSVIAQYMGRYVFDWQKQSGPMNPLDPSVLPMQQMSNATAVTTSVNLLLSKDNQILFSQTAQVQHLGTLRFEWLGLHETLSVSSLCLLNFTTHEWLVTPRIGYKLSDTIVAYLGAQVFHGPTDTLFGIIDAELSSGYVELRYTF